MIGAGTFISPLLKIITTVAILAAVYFFIVKPTLDTTESITSGINESIGESFDNFDNFSPNVQKSIRQAEKLQEQSSQTSQAQIQDANKLLSCIQQANSNIDKIQACNAKFTP